MHNTGNHSMQLHSVQHCIMLAIRKFILKSNNSTKTAVPTDNHTFILSTQSL